MLVKVPSFGLSVSELERVVTAVSCGCTGCSSVVVNALPLVTPEEWKAGSERLLYSSEFLPSL